VAKAKKADSVPAPEVAVAHALVDDLAAALEAVKAATGGEPPKLQPSSLGALVSHLRAPERERRQAAEEEARKARAAALRAELEAVESEAQALTASATDPLPPPEGDHGDKRLLCGSLRDGATGRPLPSVSVVVHPGSDRSATCAATITDEVGRFQLVIAAEDADDAQVDVLDVHGVSVTSCALPPDDPAGGELHLEVDGSKLPESRAIGETASGFRSILADSAHARIESIKAELALLEENE
jgi:hypothetical protein